MKLPFNIDLSGKVAVVTGAGGVLCGMFSKVIAAAGAKVALLDLSLERAEAVAAEIKAEGGYALPIKADVLSKECLDAVHAEVLEKLGPCDILINGAGGNHPAASTTKDYFEPGDIENDAVKSFFDLDQKGVNFVFNLNFMGTLLPTQTFAKDMLGRKDCTIINISSMNAFCPLTRIPAYSGAKAAISNFTEWLAVHFSRVGIRVNAIAPGFFLTNQNRSLLLDEEGKPTARAAKIMAATPMGRFGEAEELVGALQFLLCSEASSFVNGVVIPVDGGFNAYSGV